MIEADATTKDIPELEEKQQVEDDDKSSQKEHLPSDKDAVSEKALDAAALRDDEQLMDRPAEASVEQEPDLTGSVDRDVEESPPKQPAAVEEEETVAEQDLPDQDKFDSDVRRTFQEDDAQSSREPADAEQPTRAKVVPQISISVCSSVAADDDDDEYLPSVEDSSIRASVFEEDISYTDNAEEKVESRGTAEESTDAEILGTVDQEAEQRFDVQTEATEGDDISAEAESKQEPAVEDTEAATPEVERNLSQYPALSEREAREVTVAEVHERKEVSAAMTTTDSQQLHDATLLYSSTESMVSSTTSDWTVIDTREQLETVGSFSVTEKDATDTRLDELSASFMAQTELEVVGGLRELEAEDGEILIEGLDATVDDEGTEVAAEDYLTAAVTPTVDLMVMSTVLESILEEEERTSSSQKTTSSSEKLEHDVSDSSKLLGSSPDVQHAVESPTFQPVGKFASSGAKSSSDRDDVSVSSSLAEFERLERDLQEKGSSESFSGGDKGSSWSASAAALPESPQRKSNTSLSSSLAEFERIEHDILGQSGSLELITIERKSHQTDSSSFSELERIEEIDSASATAAEEPFRSSSGSLAEFEYIEQQLRMNEELESEALKVATMLEASRSGAEKSPDTGSSQSDVRLSKEQIPESAESLVPVEETTTQPAASAAEAQYPHYQDIVHIIREASKNVHTFQFADQETVSHTEATETVSQDDAVTTKLRQEDTTTSQSYDSKTLVKTTLFEDVSATASTAESSLSRTEHKVLEHSQEETASRRTEDSGTEDVGFKQVELPETVGRQLSSEIQEQDLMKLSTDSLVVVQSGDVMQLSTDSLQPAVMTTSTDSLELAAADSTQDVQHSSTSTLSSATTLLAAADGDDMARSVFGIV